MDGLRSEWNQFVASQDNSSFYQSWEWGTFQESLQRSVVREVLREEDSIHVLFQMTRIPLAGPFSYWLLPRGPISANEEGVTRGFVHAQKIARETGGLFLRTEPLSETTCFSRCMESVSLSPKTTLLLDLEKEPEQILSGMHEKTRYNIRLAERKGVSVREIRRDDARYDTLWQQFYALLQQTSKRGSFALHPKNYYRAMCDHFLLASGQTVENARAHIRLYCAFYGDTMLSASLVMFFGDTATYLHGASSHEQKSLMAPYLMHWSAIQDAKKMGFRFYDFWGIASTADPSDPWAGITKFKKGFGGEVKQYPGTWDCVQNVLGYRVYEACRKVNRIISTRRSMDRTRASEA